MLMASKLYSSATQIMSTPAASRSLARWAALRGSPVYATDVDSFTPPSLHALWHGDAVTGDFSIVVGSDGRVDVAVATDGRRVDVILRNAGGEPVHLDRVEIETGLRPDRVLEHGYQSWSVVRRTRPADVRPERAQLPDWVRGTHFSDPGAAGRLVSGDHFLVTDAGVVGFLDARSH